MARTPATSRNSGPQSRFETLDKIANRCALLALIAIPLGALTICGVGCNQKTPQVTEQPTRQTQKSDAEQAAQGISQIFNIDPLNQGDGVANSGSPTSQPAVTEAETGGNTTGPLASAGGATRGSRVNVVNIYNSVGTAATGAQAGGGQSGQSANATATPSNSATQKPEAAITTPVAVALPGGAANSSGVSGTGQSTPTQTNTQTADAKAVLLKGLASGQITPELFNSIAPLLGLSPVPTTAPVTTPTTP